MATFKGRAVRAALFTAASSIACPLAAQVPSADVDAAAGPDEIIVTAQRRSERAIDVPLSISSQSAEALAKAGITNLSELSTLVAGVKIDNAGTYVQPAIRGISSVVIGPGTDAPVALYLDGVYQPNQLANHFEFSDIERIEIAKGPQGTLFGRNATGGAISIFTRAPSFDAKGTISLSVGNYKDVNAQAYVTGGITDTLAGSISLLAQTHDGYNYDIAQRQRTSGLRSEAVRVKLLWQPASNVDLTVIGYYAKRFDSDAASAIALNGNSAGTLIPGAIVATEPFTTSFNDVSSIDVRTKSVTVLGNVELGAGTISSVTGYTDIVGQVVFDEDRVFNPNATRTAYIIRQPSKTFSQELTFASRKFGRFSFVAGAFYFFDNNAFEPLTAEFGTRADPTFFNFVFNSQNPQRAYAAFGEAKLELTDRFTVIAGIRYSRETRKNHGQAGMETGPGVFQFTPTIQGPSITFGAWTPRLSLNYKIADETNLYFTYSQGFKSGGVGGAAFLGGGNPQTYDPERVYAYEVGLKTRVSPMLSFNLAGYYYDYKNLQVQVNLTAANGYIENAATARIYGLDFDAVLRPLDGLTLTGGASLLHAQYKDYQGATVLQPITTFPAPASLAPCLAPTAGPQFGNYACLIDASGNQLPRAPKVQLTGTLDYEFAAGGGTAGINLTAFYSSRVFFDSAERVSQKPYTLLNGQISYRPGNGPLKIEVYGRNLTNEAYLNTLYEDAQTDGAGYGTPRTYGVRLTYTY